MSLSDAGEGLTTEERVALLTEAARRLREEREHLEHTISEAHSTLKALNTARRECRDEIRALACSEARKQ